MTDDNVVSLRGGSYPVPATVPETDQPYYASLPTAEDMDALLLGKRAKGIVVILINEDGFISDYTDGLTQLERLGALSIVNYCMINNGNLPE